MTARPLPTYYLPHGGGPCFFMSWPAPMERAWDGLAAFLRGLLREVDPAPRAIVVISAHYESIVPTVTTAVRPPMLFDYYGFPESTYRLRYDAPGSPELASRIRALLGAAGIASSEDDERGFDHGVFVPMLLVEPTATIPVVQLSLTRDLDPERHLAVGAALEPLRSEGALIVGSGMSYHNLRAFGRPDPPGGATFDRWLEASVTAAPRERHALLAHWSEAPGARLAHPREEHFLPLLVAAGAAPGDAGHRVFHETIAGSPISGYRFG